MQTSGCGGDPFTHGLCIGSIRQSLFGKDWKSLGKLLEEFLERCAVGKTFIVEEKVNNKISPQTVFSLQRTLRYFCMPNMFALSH